MTQTFINRLLTVVCLCMISNLFAQENFTGYLQSQLGIDYKVKGIYSQNFSLSNRNYAIDEGELLLRKRHLDLAHFSKWDIKDNQNVALGVLYRLIENFENEFRFTEQFNITDKPNAVRYVHRFRIEQRITKPLTTHRFRYRFALDVPLKGENLDPGEPYFFGTIENLLSVAKNNLPQYDTRLSGQMGWQLNRELKFQIGLEYWIGDYTSRIPQHAAFLLMSTQLAL